MKKIFLTCLLVGTLVLTMCMSAFASSGQYVPPSMKGSCDSYIIFKPFSDASHDYFTCIIYDSSDYKPEYRTDNNSTRILLRSLVDSPSAMYRSMIKMSTYDSSSTNNGWGSLKEMSGNISDCYQIYQSNQDIYDMNGDLFFQGPPPPTMAQKVIMSMEEALANLLTTVGGTMKILVLCGIGCLALLIGLRLFGKVLHRFQA